jgi:hypothetical protein
VTKTTTTIDFRPLWSRWWLAAIALSGVSACSSDDLILPGDGQPARIAPVGEDQTGIVGQTLEHPLVVQVTDSEDRPVPGVEVVFIAPPGGGFSSDATVRSGPDGRAAVQYTLSTTAGEQVVEARADAIVPSTAASTTLRVIARPDHAQELTKDSRDPQVAQVSTVLPESVAVKAIDRFGNGVPGVEVTWEASGGGSVSPSSVVTGSDGRAATQRTLGDRPGPHETRARAGGLEGSPISFTAIAVAAPRPELVLVIQPPSTAAAGVPLDPQPELQLQDAVGAPLARAEVAVTVQIESGEGSLGGRTTVRSDANGRVRFTDLEIRGEPGVRTLIFAADGFTTVTSVRVAVSPGPPAAERSSASVSEGRAGEATSITIRLRDEFDTDVEGAAEQIAVSVDGANPLSGLEVSDEGGGSYSASYVPTRTGSDVIDVRVAGASLPGSPYTSVVSPGPADPSTTTAVVTRAGVFFSLVTVEVTTRDAHGNLLGRGGDLVQIQVNGGPPRNAQDRGDGTYYDEFVTVALTIEIAITLNGVPLAGSPYRP